MWCSSSLAAQSIRGQVVDAVTSAPIISALIEVRADSGGAVIRRTTDRTGRYFVVLPGPGRYHVGIAAIGYERKRSQPVDVAADVLVLPEVRLGATSVQLAELVTTAAGGDCRMTPEASARLSRILDAGADALQVMRATVTAGTLRLGAEVIDRTVMLTRREPLVEDDTSRIEQLQWPLHAVSSATLEAGGFALEGAGPSSSAWEFYGPDAEVLFAPWFLATHCFDAVGSANADSLVVSFRPVRRSGDRVDIAGRLVFDARTLVLRRMDFEHQNLPSGMPGGTVGGEVQFAPTAEGTWLPVGWRMRAPIASGPSVVTYRSGGFTQQRIVVGGSRVIGRREVIGRVLLDRR